MSSQRLAQLFRFLVIAGSVLAVVSASSKMINSPLAKGDVEAYLHGARLILAGQDIYATPSRPPEMGGLYYIYPPPLAVLFVPFAFLPVDAAIVLWTVANVVLVGWILKALYEAMTGSALSAVPFERRWTIIFFALLPPSRFILHHLFYGQANILIMALAILGLKQVSAARSVRGGIMLGVSAAIKVVTYPFLLWFVLRKNWKASAGIVAGIAGGLLLPALVLGFGRNWDYLVYWLRNIALSAGLTAGKVPLSVNVSVQAQMYRFFSDSVAYTYQDRAYYLTIYRLPEAALIFAQRFLLVVMFAAMIAYGYRFRKSRELISHWGGVVLTFSLVSVFTPFAQKHYLVFLCRAFLYLTYAWHVLELEDKRFHQLVIASFVCLFCTNEEFVGEYLGGIFAGMGCYAWGVLLVCAAIFRMASCLDAKKGSTQSLLNASLS